MIRLVKPTLVAMALIFAACGSAEKEAPQPSTEAQDEGMETLANGTEAQGEGMESLANGTEAQTDSTDSQLEWITLENGLRYADMVVGDGEEVRDGHTAEMHYTGWLYDESAPENKGVQFDSSRDRDATFPFTVGTQGIIQGWNVGIPGMKVGGRRMLLIPPELGYGSASYGPIPGGATLLFDVELVAIL